MLSQNHWSAITLSHLFQRTLFHPLPTHFLSVVYPLGVPAMLYIWLRSFRHRLDPQGEQPEVVKEARKRDQILEDAPITKLALVFEPRWWWTECFLLFRRLVLTSGPLGTIWYGMVWLRYG